MSRSVCMSLYVRSSHRNWKVQNVSLVQFCCARILTFVLSPNYYCNMLKEEDKVNTPAKSRAMGTGLREGNFLPILPFHRQKGVGAKNADLLIRQVSLSVGAGPGTVQPSRSSVPKMGGGGVVGAVLSNTTFRSFTLKMNYEPITYSFYLTNKAANYFRCMTGNNLTISVSLDFGRLLITDERHY